MKNSRSDFYRFAPILALIGAAAAIILALAGAI